MAYKFINPYNFVPLGNEPKRESSGDVAKKYTGCIEYSLETRTPLFIPNTSNDKAFEISKKALLDTNGNEKSNKDENVYHKSYDFFSYENLQYNRCYDNESFTPVIPGSEVRGLIRSTYEMLTNSCMSALDDYSNMALSKRNCQIFKPGLIEHTADGKFNLHDAEDYLLRTKGENILDIDLSSWEDSVDKYARKCYKQKNLQEGQRVSFEYKENGRGKKLVSSLNTGKNIGYVIKGEDGPEMPSRGGAAKNQKHCIHVFALKKAFSQPIVSNVSVASLDIVLKQYKDNAASKYEEYSKNWSAFKNTKDRGFFPVYYSSIDNKYYMFSPASITREVYKNKISQMLKNHMPCNSKMNLCPACSLFGTVITGNNMSAVASHIRVSDLYTEVDKKDCFEKIVTLKELSSPKIENTEYYLKKPDGAQYWTFDYYIKNGGNVVPYCPEINGRKIYWHHPDFKLANALATEVNERNMTIRPVKSGIVFRGKLFFDGISKTDLDRIIEVLNCCDNGSLKEKKHGYKLGAGKPLGLGSIALNVDSVILREIKVDTESKKVSLVEIPYQEKETAKFDLTVSNTFSEVTDFEALRKNVNDGCFVSYPKIEENGTIFEWFVKNHKAYDIDKKNGGFKNISMPNKRTQVYFDQYMKAGKPDLVKNADKPNIQYNFRK